jgi:hypothetical protein
MSVHIPIVLHSFDLICSSVRGVMPTARLADGHLVLVLVHACSRPQYLRFLLKMAAGDVRPGVLPFVSVHNVTAVQVGCHLVMHTGYMISGVLSVTRMHRPRGIIECFRIRQVAQSGCGITTYSENNAGGIRRQLNVGN